MLIEDFGSKVTLNNYISFYPQSQPIFRRVGKLIVIHLRFTTPTAVLPDLHICTLPEGYRPILRSSTSFIFTETWKADSTAGVNIYENDVVLASTAWKANTGYVGTLVYIAER